jgi:hypothetical protein
MRHLKALFVRGILVELLHVSMCQQDELLDIAISAEPSHGSEGTSDGGLIAFRKQSCQECGSLLRA